MRGSSRKPRMASRPGRESFEPASSPEPQRACACWPLDLGNLVSRATRPPISVVLSPQLAVLCYSPRDISTGTIPVLSLARPSPAVVSRPDTSSAVRSRMAGASTDPDGSACPLEQGVSIGILARAAGLHRFILAAGKPVFPIPASEAPREGTGAGATILLLAGGLWSQRFGEAEGKERKTACFDPYCARAVTHVPPALPGMKA